MPKKLRHGFIFSLRMVLRLLKSPLLILSQHHNIYLTRQVTIPRMSRNNFFVYWKHKFFPYRSITHWILKLCGITSRCNLTAKSDHFLHKNRIREPFNPARICGLLRGSLFSFLQNFLFLPRHSFASALGHGRILSSNGESN